MLANLVQRAPKDDDGLYIIEPDDDCVGLFNIVISNHEKDWDAIAVLKEYTNVMLRSRLAGSVVGR